MKVFFFNDTQYNIYTYNIRNIEVYQVNYQSILEVLNYYTQYCEQNIFYHIMHFFFLFLKFELFKKKMYQPCTTYGINSFTSLSTYFLYAALIRSVYVNDPTSTAMRVACSCYCY